jgi:hypothetical protein
MAPGSPAELIPFTRFLERRQQRHRIAVANGTVAMLEPADLGTRPDGRNRERGRSAVPRISEYPPTMSPGDMSIV